MTGRTGAEGNNSQACKNDQERKRLLKMRDLIEKLVEDVAWHIKASREILLDRSIKFREPVPIKDEVCELCGGAVYDTPSGVLCNKCGGGVPTRRIDDGE